MSTAQPAKTTKPDKQATRIAEVLSERVFSGSTVSWSELLTRLGDESDVDKIGKSFSKPPLKGNWVVAVPKWAESPIVRPDQLDALSRDPAFLVKLAERVCSAEQPEQPLAQLLKPVEKTLSNAMATYWTSNVEQFPSELQPIIGGTAKKKTVRVHLKKYPSPAEVLSECLLRSLQAIRERDHDHYPASINEILSDDLPFTGYHEDAVNVEPFASKVITLFKPGKKGVEQLYGLIDDREMLSGSTRVLQILWGKSQKPGDDGVSLKELVKQVKALVEPQISGAFQQQIEHAINRRRLPSGLASLKMGKDIILFDAKNLLRTSSEPPRAAPVAVATATVPSASANTNHGERFAEEFERVFDRLFKQGGQLRSVKLSELRANLNGYSRDEFNRGLNDLRRQEKFTLEPNEGQRVQLTDQEQAAGIVEAGQSFYFCRRK